LVANLSSVRVEQRVLEGGGYHDDAGRNRPGEAMHKIPFTLPVRWGLVVACLCTMINSTTAGSFTRGCAARDLQILMLIEDREDTNAVSAEKLGDAMLAMLEARIVCHEGRVIDAMALYDGISRSIAPDPLYPLGADEGR
jgi:hypothetical protein